MPADISTLRNKYFGHGAYIVGAGPSVRRLRVHHFHDPLWPVLCVNRAAAHVALLNLPNDVYLVQQDGGPHDNYVKPGITPIVHYIQEYLFVKHDHRIIYHPNQWRMGLATSTGEIAVEIAKLMGCCFLMFYCFDAAVNGDGPELYKKVGKNIKKVAKGVPACWALPE